MYKHELEDSGLLRLLKTEILEERFNSREVNEIMSLLNIPIVELSWMKYATKKIHSGDKDILIGMIDEAILYYENGIWNYYSVMLDQIQVRVAVLYYGKI